MPTRETDFRPGVLLERAGFKVGVAPYGKLTQQIRSHEPAAPPHAKMFRITSYIETIG